MGGKLLKFIKTIYLNKTVFYLHNGYVGHPHLLESREGKKAIVTPIILNAVVVIIAALSYIQELVYIDFGIDQLIIADNKAMEAGKPFPGRMSPVSSILFIIIASSLLLIKCKIKLRYVQYTLHAVTLISIIAIIGYMFNTPDFYTLNFVTSMAVHTSVAFLLLSLSAALINSHLVLSGVFTAREVGNVMARRLSLVMFSATAVLSLLHFLEHKYNLLHIEFHMALFAVAAILINIFIIWK